ncbi:isoprenyl transferase [Thermovenabulum gondwanense]|uniref:Isoprenyl transferase n=1 Tax=Thermovenabulum gondwanense TaxID=520767 RepID=A0A161PWM5_9FIRM|nr:isoprenyl transferase [Thermovenabulum gondwanense]KYO65780.1 Ditrans,polycis-undecaprenyl-diphosphate synthase ((2E,6E)-farnesyl-diphosphate specific) [Thermovenabulum gondwanense]
MIDKIIPSHIAIIMDGNGRWARSKGLPRIAGHWAGADSLKEIVEYCAEIGVKVLTVYAFSTENWKRPYEEVSTIFNLLRYFLQRETDRLKNNNIKIKVSGDIERLPKKVKEEIKKSLEKTINCSGLILNIAVNYGGRDEILRACKKIADEVKKGNLEIDEIDDSLFKKYLYTEDLPDPDLLIRPSGELRISNFLLYQLAYTELWFCEKTWPDFKKDDLMRAISDFQKRDRRFGGLNNNNDKK